MKTTLYIDGYNLYYGLVKNTPYKWLDLVKLLTPIAKENTPDLEIVAVKYFTSPVKTSFSTHGNQSDKSQSDYHKALKHLYQQFEIIKGYFDATKGRFPVYKRPPDRNDTVETWKLEEKQTDVNIALHMYRDIAKGAVDQVIVISNDSDLAPALQAIREDFPEARLGAIMPIRKRDGEPTRPPNASISKYTDWTRSHVNESELQENQLPQNVPARKTAKKPIYW